MELGDYFRYYDSDKNGNLDKAEFAKMCAHLTKNGYNLKLMNFSFEALDKVSFFFLIITILVFNCISYRMVVV